MTLKTAAKTVLIIAIIGMAFSGYLAYRELFTGSCATNFIRCGSVRVADLPACVYGFIMYAFVVIIISFGLAHKQTAAPTISQ